jgi:hypothetical protein
VTKLIYVLRSVPYQAPPVIVLLGREWFVVKSAGTSRRANSG